MIKRTVEISKESVHLAVRYGQLRIERHGADPREAPSIPCEDIGLLLVDAPQTTYSHSALTTLMESGAVFVVCGRQHLPVGMMVPLPAHTETVSRIRDQIDAGKPLQKHLWRQIVVAKIRAQAANLPADGSPRSKLIVLSREVKSGDTSNVEAQAAKIYWAAWLGPGVKFRRDPDGHGLNAMLNYGYAVLRAAVARALVAAGLHPALGIHHSNRSNTFCLADDLVEPIRPLVDARVRDLREWGMESLDQGAKAHLLALLTATVRVDSQAGPLMVGLHRTVASLVRCYQRSSRTLSLPTVAQENP